MSELSVNLNTAAEFPANCEQSVSADKALMQQVASGNEVAIVRLIEQHGETLAQLVGRLTAWHVDSEDILQDVLVTAWQKASSFRGQGSLEGWLKQIAVNRCRNHFRTVATMRRKLESFVALGLSTAFRDRQVYDDHPSESDSELQQALEKLPHADRMILVLYYLEEHSGHEVARMLQIREETMHVRLHRARKKLKQSLTRYGSE